MMCMAPSIGAGSGAENAILLEHDTKKNIHRLDLDSNYTTKRYGMTMTHLPNNVCPLANKASREFAVAGCKKIPEASQKHDVNVVSMDHFDPEHRVIGIFEAESIENVRIL